MWHDQQGNPYALSEEEQRRLRTQLKQLQQQTEAKRQRAEAAEQQAEAERKERMRLVEYVRSLGIDPDNLPNEQ